MKSREAARRPPHDNQHVSTPEDEIRVTDSEPSFRVWERHRKRAFTRLAEQTMPLARYYGPQALLPIPLGEIYVQGRWAA